MNLYQFCGESARVNGSGLRYAVADAYERWSDVDEWICWAGRGWM